MTQHYARIADKMVMREAERSSGKRVELEGNQPTSWRGIMRQRRVVGRRRVALFLGVLACVSACLGQGCDPVESEACQDAIENWRSQATRAIEEIEEWRNALEEANDTIETMNHSIEFAQIYQGTSYGEMEVAIALLETGDTVDEPSSDF